MMQESISAHPTDIAVIHDDVRFTYQDLEDNSNRLSQYLGKHNVQIKSNVAFLMRRSFDMLTAILAIWKQGATYIPLDPKTPPDRINRILSNMNPSCIISDPALLSKISASDSFILTLRDVEYLRCETTSPQIVKNPDDLLAYMIYTSGSTGEPKGVMLTHSNITNHVLWLIQDFKFTSQDCFSFNSSMAFDFSVACTLLPLAVGAKIVITSEEDTLDLETYCKQLEKHKVSFAKWTPSYFKLLVDYVENNRPDFSAFRFIMLGGEELLTSYVERWLNVFPTHTIINEYGPTEAAVGITTCVIKRDTLNRALHTVPIGKPAINTTLYVVDSKNNIVQDGEVGELLIGGASVARGYYKQPELTADRFIEDPFSNHQQKLYRTGDLVKKLPDANYLYVGRIDNQVKVDGYRIELNEIEHWILQYPTIKHVKTIVEKQEDNAPMIVAYLITDKHASIDFGDLKTYLSECLPQFMMPNHFFLVDHIPCNRNGKVDIPALKNQIIKSEINHNQAFSVFNKFVATIIESLKQHMDVDQIDLNASFFSIGITSLLAVQLVNNINHRSGSILKIQDLFAYPTILSLADYLEKQVTLLIDHDQSSANRLDQESDYPQEPIAIIAMDCRLPGADDCEALWELCREGKESISFFEPAEKEQVVAKGNEHMVYAKGVLNNIEYFDADFFNFTPREANLSDPQHRLLIESSWIALEKAGYIPNPEDSHKIGVYVSMNDSTYLLHHNLVERLSPILNDRFSMQRLMSPQCLATKIAYQLNCTGPSVTIQTACSSSLVSVVLACQQLASHQCNLALAGGISIVTPQDAPYFYQKGNIFSPDGRCRPFDENAEGTVFSNGLGIVVLKRLSDALRDNDSIICVIKGTATNNDGGNKMSYTAPTIQGQMLCILSAQNAARIEADTIQYIETHGTGTLIGDPIEIEALTKAFQTTSYKQQTCAIGSLKANIGHTHVAAGVAGLIKTALALQNKQIPPSINFNKPNPHIDWEHSPFYLNKRLQYWTEGKTPRRAGVSAFGVGGTNAHVIVEEAPEPLPSYQHKKNRILLFSAKTKEALWAMQDNLIRYFEQVPHDENQTSLLADAAYTLEVGRKKFPYRSGIISNNILDTIEQLKNTRGKYEFNTNRNNNSKPNIVFLFPGQGTQYSNLTLTLYQEEPTYKKYLDLCLNFASSYTKHDLKLILFPTQTPHLSDEHIIHQTEWTHPILFSVEYALASLLMDWGIKPDVMLGHSLGEYVAACLSGVFSLEDAMKLICARGDAIAKSEEGAMFSAPLSKKEALPYCNDDIDIAAINTDNLLVFSGRKRAIDALYKQLSDTLSPSAVSFLHRLNCSRPFHSKLLKPAARAFQNKLQTIHMKMPKIPYLSNVTGNWISELDIKNSNYWVDHMLNTVQFSQCAKQLAQQQNTIFLEIGSGRALLSMIQQHSKNTISAVELMPSARNSDNKNQMIEQALKTLWCRDYPINWGAYYKHEKRRRIALPTYPFQRKRFWFDSVLSTVEPNIDLSSSTSASLFYVPSWLRDPEPMKHVAFPDLNSQERGWIIFDDNSALCKYTIDSLEQANESYFIIKKSSEFKYIGSNTYTINAKDKMHYKRAISAIVNEKIHHYAILHFWGMSKSNNLNKDNLLESYILYDGLYSGVFIIQAFQEIKPAAILSTTMITTQIHSVIGNEIIEPLKSCVLSLCRVLPLENKNYRFNAIDVESVENSAFCSRFASNIIHTALTGLYQKNYEAPLVLAFRNQYCWKPTYKNISIDEKNSGLSFKSGVYFITGGLGAMGLTIADWLSKKISNATLVLIARTPFPDQVAWDDWQKHHGLDDVISEKIQKLKQIKKRGCHLIIASGDVANYTQMKDLVETIEKDYGKITGIFHLAGVAGEGIAVLKNMTTMHSVLASKIQGIGVLSQLFKKVPLDFIVCASSLTALAGGVGQLDYCAANLFLDHFMAQHPFEKCKRQLTINWNSWSSIGMAAHVNSSTIHEKLYLGNSITPNQAMVILDNLFNTGYEQLIISHFSPTAERERIIAAFEKTNHGSSAPTATINNLSTRDVIKKIWQDLLGVKAIGEEDTFYSLGGDSLLVIQLLMALEDRFGVNITLQEMAHTHTLHSLTTLIEMRPLRSINTIVSLQNNTLNQTHHHNKSVYFIHPIGGTVFCYFPLASYLKNHSLYAIQDPELAQEKILFNSIKEMGEFYSKEIHLKHKNEEIVLVGSSFGGNVAMEMINPLAKLGISVKKVILIDSWANLGDAVQLKKNKLVSVDHMESLKMIKKYYGDQSSHYQSIVKRLMWLRSYVPSVVNVEVVLLAAKELLPIYKKMACTSNGWIPYCSNSILRYTINGNHDTMLQTENLPQLCELLDGLI